ncbi:MAG: cytochrome B [Balneolaceae bacterium]|nr:cytochrome B [Balneolaceae bacterium]
MYTGLQHLHSYLAYLVIFGLIVGIVNGLAGWFKERSFEERDRKLALPGLIMTHLQLLFGLILYFVSPLGWGDLSGSAMGDPVSRLYVLEHPLTMIIAVVMVTVGYSRAKKPAEDKKRFRSHWLYYSIGLALMLSRIPWQAWP